MRTLPYVLLTVVLVIAGFTAGALFNFFGANQNALTAQLDPEAPRIAADLAQTQAKVIDLASQLEAAKESRTQLRKELESARTEIEQLQTQVDETEDARTDAQTQAEDLESRNSALKSRIAELNDRVTEARRQVQEAAASAQDAAASDARPSPAPANDAADTTADTATEMQPTAEALEPISPTAEQRQSLLAGVEAYRAQDYREAYELWRPLAQQGYVRAQFHLGALFYEGRGIARDDVLARAWLTLAKRHGSKNAAGLLEQLDTRITAKQRRAAEDLIASTGE